MARAARNAGRLLRRTPPLVDRFAGFGGRIAAFIRERTYQVALIEHFWCAPYVEQVARRPSSPCSISTMWNPCCTRAAPKRSRCRWRWRITLFAGRVWRSRKSGCRASTACWWRRRTMRGVFEAIAPGGRVQVYANAIPAIAQPDRAEQDVIAFSGNFGYHPNVSGIKFFVSKIWPGLRAQWPNLVLRLIGKNATAVSSMVEGDSRIELCGPVSNAVEELAAAKVVVVPLLAGSGTRLKIIEAWAAGRAVVSTRIGAEGLPARDGENILLADEPARFAEAVSKLLSSPAERARLGRAGRALFELHFTWERVWQTLDL